MKRFAALAALLLLWMPTACMDQYHPEPYWAQFKREREIAARPVARLTETGEIPVAGAEKQPIAEVYASICAACHGAHGDGDGPAGVALNPHPRVLSSAEWQGKVDDAHIAKVIKEGGASVGLSPLMAPFGAVIGEDRIPEMVAHIRSLKK